MRQAGPGRPIALMDEGHMTREEFSVTCAWIGEPPYQRVTLPRSRLLRRERISKIDEGAAVNGG